MTDSESSDATRLTDERVEDLVERCIGLLEDCGEAGVEAELAKYPAEAERVRLRLAQLRARGLLDESPHEPRVPDRLGGFRVVRPLGRGGMGAVYLAHDEDLDRPVALKVLLGVHLLQPGARLRFRREVDTIARLQHPGIVPVHAVGEDEGVPWFAMDVVPGLSLAQALKRLRETSAAEIGGGHLARLLGSEHPLFDGAWPRVALRIVLQATEAIEHAHARGVIHRDVKPSNIMITPDGRVVVLDFGLAFADTATRLTTSGSLVGSLPYMAPEQVRGELASLDARTDVYALGVTLYELLTLRNPYLAETTEVTRAQVLEAAPRAPRSLNPAIPSDVEAVCLTAMDAEPHRRYASTSALAADLTAALEGRPISARRPSAPARVVRWARRHPARASAAALAVLLFVGGPITVAVLERASGREIRRALEEARRHQQATERQRALVMRAYDRSRILVDRVLTRMADGRLMFEPAHQELRAWMLQEAHDAYAELAREQSDDPRIRAAVIDATRRLGRIAGEQGRLADATAKLEGAVAAAQALERDAGPDRELALVQVDSLKNLLHLYSVLGRNAAASSAAEARVRIWERLVAASPERLQDEAELADALRDAAAQAMLLGRNDDARALFLRCRALWQSVVDRDSRPGFRRALAMVIAEGALIRERLGLPGEGMPEIERAIALLEQTRRDSSWDYDVERQLAKCYQMAGTECRRLEDSARAVAFFRRSVELDRATLERYPNDVATRYVTALGEMGVATTLHGLGQHDEAEPFYRASLENHRRLVEAVPDHFGHAVNLAVAQKTFGASLSRAGRWSEAAEMLVRAATGFAAIDPIDLPAHTSGVPERTQQELADVLELASPEALLDVARHLVAIVEATPAERTAYAAWAVRCLEAAVAGGLEEPERIEADPALAPLRPRSDFQHLLDDL